MSQHTPWSQEEAEKWAKEYALKVRSCSESAQRHEDSEQDFLAGLTKAAEFIEKSPTMYGSHVGDPINRYWEGTRASCDTHEAKLVGIKPIEQGEGT